MSSHLIEVIYYLSACVGLRTEELSILCDPWFTPGAYDGAWYPFPEHPDPLSILGRYDFIYISHLHPDHYDPVFLRRYLARYPDTRIIIADFKFNYLSKLMTRDKIPHEIRSILVLGLTDIHLIPFGDSINDFDSILVMKRGDHSVVNWNDNFYKPELIKKTLALAPKPTIALLPYTGAGPYPQTYYEDPKSLEVFARLQKELFLSRYMQLALALKAEIRIPFAGKYLLGGKLAPLNPYRGVSDAVEILALDPQALVLADHGKGIVNTKEMQAGLKPFHIRVERYSKEAVEAAVAKIQDRPMDYELYLKQIPLEKIPFHRLLMQSYRNALLKSEQVDPYVINIHYGAAFPFSMTIGKSEAKECPVSEITIDPHYLFGLLTGLFHWNNAETGSQFCTKRTGHYSRAAQDFLNFFHV
jgi:UDP-MurNAc hydroxylase